jgi:hypothetical protein
MQWKRDFIIAPLIRALQFRDRQLRGRGLCIPRRVIAVFKGRVLCGHRSEHSCNFTGDLFVFSILKKSKKFFKWHQTVTNPVYNET